MTPDQERPTHHLRSALVMRCLEPSTLALAVAVARGAATSRSESLTVISDGEALVPLEVTDRFGGRTHVVDAAAGPLVVTYEASIAAATASPPVAAVIDDVRLEFMRQSRYCPSDALTGFARTTFGDAERGSALAHRVAEWVHEFLVYEAGSSRALDTAVETLLFARGVCRDFAHLAVALCRGLGMSARVAAVYAPGLAPMDFHAVAEVHTEHGWEVLDPTRLAPRRSLVRIATGRDAADTAFATTVRGDVALDSAEVVAVVEGDLPVDDHSDVVHLA